MKSKASIIFSLIISVLLTGACSKDWLSPAPEDILIADDTLFYNHPEYATQFVNAAYSQLLQWEVSFSWIGASSITSDNADKGSAPGNADAGKDKLDLDNLIFTPTCISFEELWFAFFNGISACNQAIANVPRFAVSDSLKNRLIAEARFLRAHYYFNLVRCYGDVPLIDSLIDANNPSDLAKATTRESKENIYAFIENDLNYAINHLLIKGDSEWEEGRATKGAAKGLLAKVCMYEKKWEQAFDLSEQIINQEVGTYSLEPDYATIWREAGQNGSESLFEVQCNLTGNRAAVDGYAFYQWPRGNNVTAVYYPNLTDSIGNTGNGFNSPSAALDSLYETGDLRKAATIIHLGDTLWDGAVVNTGCYNERYNYKAYVSKTQETNIAGDPSMGSKNIRILRLGEIYLIHAEAANELNNLSLAKTSLNLIRNRAGLPHTTAASQDELREAIWKERRVELAMEHDRWFDLIRQGSDRTCAAFAAVGKNFIIGKHEVFPIPNTQIVLSQGKLKQNPGY